MLKLTAEPTLEARYAWRPRRRRKSLAAVFGWSLALLGLSWLLFSAIVGFSPAT
jgi:hypothetical protein